VIFSIITPVFSDPEITLISGFDAQETFMIIKHFFSGFFDE